jgi:hypothetical protein
MLFFTGRRKPVPGGLAAAVQAADTHEKQHVKSPCPSHFKLNVVGNQLQVCHAFFAGLQNRTNTLIFRDTHKAVVFSSLMGLQ